MRESDTETGKGDDREMATFNTWLKAQEHRKDGTGALAVLWLERGDNSRGVNGVLRHVRALASRDPELSWTEAALLEAVSEYQGQPRGPAPLAPVPDPEVVPSGILEAAESGPPPEASPVLAAVRREVGQALADGGTAVAYDAKTPVGEAIARATRAGLDAAEQARSPLSVRGGEEMLAAILDRLDTLKLLCSAAFACISDRLGIEPEVVIALASEIREISDNPPEYDWDALFAGADITADAE